jgi:hypothetical protein
MHKYLAVISFTLFASASVSAAEQAKPVSPPKPQDFAYALPLQFEDQDALYQTTLPLSVYQYTVRGDLGDMRVFNAQGEVVPHMLVQQTHSTTSQPERRKLAWFPLRGAANAGLDQLSVRIKRNAAGTLIDINSNAKPQAQATLSGYLLDASAVKPSIQALELDWKNSKESFVGTVTVESSDDLKHWNSVVRGAPLTSLQFGGHSLSQKRVELPSLRAKYLRLSWPQNMPSLQLTSVNVELAGTRIDTPLNWHTSAGSAVADKAGEYQFDLGAHLPLQRMRIELPQINTLVQAALFSRSRPEHSWQPAGNAVLYKLHHSGQDVKNTDIAVSGNHRYWLLRVEQKSGGLGTGLPGLQAGWQPHQLQFVTRGSAPFQLAYGNKEIKPAEFQINNIFPHGEGESALKVQPARTGVQIELGGEARLLADAPPLPWKKWILWSVLCAAVVLLGWMAYRLVKQMENHDKS